MSPALTPSPEDVIAHIRRNHMTFCAGQDKLEVLLAAVRHCRANNIAGAYLEAGVAMGGSAMVIAAAKPPAAPLLLFDVFETLPPPSEMDGEKATAIYAAFQNGDITDPVSRRYFEHRHDLLPLVREQFSALGLDPQTHNVAFHRGLFEDTLNITGPVAFFHIDCDWYESVKLCLDRVAPHVTPGGFIVFDDYNSFEGCRKAVDEWLPTAPHFQIAHKGWTVAVQRQNA